MNYKQAGYDQRVNDAGYHWQELDINGHLQLAMFEGKKPVVRDLGDTDWEWLDKVFREAPGLTEEEIKEQYRDPDYNLDGYAYSHYCPMDKPNLFRKFAELVSKEDVLQFVNRFGLLGIPTSIPKFKNNECGEVDASPFTEQVELASTWGREIRLMRIYVSIWDKLSRKASSGNVLDLRDVIVWKNGVCFVKNPLLRTLEYTNEEECELADLTDDIEYVKRMENKDITAPALEILRLMISRQLANRVTSTVEWGKPEYKALSILYKPNNLIGAMWLQFAQMVTHSDKLKTCPCCGKVFSYQRKTKLFCSEACQKQFSRQQKDVVSTQGF